jgi:hypothetical protein
MCGLIWFVQIVHYPLFKHVPGPAFVPYARLHSRLTAWVVIPVMLLELGTGILLPLQAASALPASLAWANLAGIGLTWLSTFLLQVPMHQRLAQRFDPSDHRRLVLTNWIRTVLWTVRFVTLVAVAVN